MKCKLLYTYIVCTGSLFGTYIFIFPLKYIFSHKKVHLKVNCVNIKCNFVVGKSFKNKIFYATNTTID